jgi:hypothetical protein
MQKKTEKIEFIPGALAARKGTKPLQYLGFLFDGEQYLLRSQTLAKFYRRLHRAVSFAKQQHKKSIKGKIHGRDILHKRSLSAKITHLGLGNFITGYAAKARSKMKGDSIRRQLAKHPKILQRVLDR